MKQTGEELRQILNKTYVKATKILTKENTSTISADVSNNDISRLNQEAQEALYAYEKISKKYKNFISKNYNILENLIGLACGRYYMSLARKYIKKVQKIIKILHSLNSSNQSIAGYINEIENLISAYRNEAITLSELKARLAEILKLLGLINQEITAEINGYETTIDPDTGESILKESVSLNGSTIVYETWRSSYLAGFKDTGSVHGDSTEAGAIISLISNSAADMQNPNIDNVAYLTWPSKKIHNLKMKFVQDKVFLWIYKSYYIGIYEPENDDEDSIAVRMKAKTFWLGKQILEEPAVLGFEISTGYGVEADYYEVSRSEVNETNYNNYFVKGTIKKNKKAGISEDTDVYTRAEEYDANEQHYFRRVRKTLDTVKTDDLQTKNMLNESYDIQNYKSKSVKALSIEEDEIQHTKTVIVLDEDSYEPNNPDKLAESAEVYIYDVNGTTEVLKYQMDMNASSQKNGTYEFKSNLSEPDDEDEKSETTSSSAVANTTIAGNTKTDIPIILVISDRTYDESTNTYKSTINFHMDDSQSVALTDLSQYEPLEYIMTNVDSKKESITDLRTVLRERPNANVLNSMNDILNTEIADDVSDSDLDDLLDKLNACLQALTESENAYLKHVRRYMSSTGKSFNTFILGENVRTSIDAFYNSDLYSSITTSMTTHYTDLSSYSDLSLTAIIEKINDDSINKLITEILETSVTLDSTILDMANALIIIRKVQNHYEPLFGHTLQDNSLSALKASLNTAISVYTGEQLYSSMYNYAEEMFLYMNLNSDNFSTWLNSIKEYCFISDDILLNYYIFDKIIVKTCFDSASIVETFKPCLSALMLEMIRNGDIDSVLLTNNTKRIIQYEKDLYDLYGVLVEENLNAGKVPLLLTNNNKYLNDINYIDLRQLLTLNNGVVSESKHYIALSAALYKALYYNNFEETVSLIHYYLTDFLNFRTMILIKEFNKILTSLSTDSVSYEDFKVLPDKINHIVDSYYAVHSFYYGDDEHNIYDDAILSDNQLYYLLH